MIKKLLQKMGLCFHKWSVYSLRGDHVVLQCDHCNATVKREVR